MMILTAVAQGTQPDYVALAMVLVLALIVVVMAIRKSISNRNKAAAAPGVTPATEIPKKAEAPGTAGQLKLHNVEPKTAAMVMAIVADQMGKSLNELRFISIKEVQKHDV